MTFVNKGSVLAVGILFLILGCSAVTARFYVRREKKSGLGIDDWLMLPALVSKRLLNRILDIDVS